MPVPGQPFGTFPKHLAEAFSFLQLFKAGVSSAGSRNQHSAALRTASPESHAGNTSPAVQQPWAPGGGTYQVLGLPNARPRAGGHVAFSWREQGMAHAG